MLVIKKTEKEKKKLKIRHDHADHRTANAIDVKQTPVPSNKLGPVRLRRNRPETAWNNSWFV